MIGIKFMMAFATLIAFASARHLPKDGKCDNDYITCDCGTNGTKFQAAVQKCLEKNPETGKKSCEICNKHAINGEFCEKFKNCGTCLKNVNRCVTCPEGKTGPFCTENKIPDDLSILMAESNLTFPISIKIKRGEPLRDNRFLRSAAGCNYPSSVETSDIHCTIHVEKVICTQTCIWGYTLSDGKSKQVRCSYRENRWTPSEFDECQPYVNCNILFKTAGEMFCTYNKMESGPSCDLSCSEYDDQPAAPLGRHDCLLTGEWSPPLPHCIAKDTSLVLAPAPKY